MDQLAGKRIVILGAARQGTALAKFAAGAGASVLLSDLRSAETLAAVLADLDGLGIEFMLGRHTPEMLDGADLLAISGGVPADAPMVVEARSRGIAVSNDSQEFIKRAPCPVIGITGSAGKSTTTALTGAMGQASGRTTWVGGNIGRPLIADLSAMSPGDLAVQELSSFQLEIWEQSPAVAAILNITPNHLDRHKRMSAYIAAKGNILRYQSSADIALLSADDPAASGLHPLVKGRLRQFSLQGEVDDGAFLRDGEIWLRSDRETAVCSLELVKVRGRHNILNVMAAVVLADSVGIPVGAMRDAISSFTGVEHRLELVETIGGVQYINDSIATAPERALAAVDSFREPIILLAGGKDKDMAWESWAARVRRAVRHVVLFGELADTLQKELRQASAADSSAGAGVTRVETMAEAVAAAAAIARSGDVVLLSPGGTSFDAFVDFAQRGEAFRKLVFGLKPDAGMSLSREKVLM